ncbi:MAG TPA: methyltransferase domain-containing protein [Stellaceae bacterium]|nr:methyltransferase domain-containing protein [Stellaceae bacterium]
MTLGWQTVDRRQDRERFTGYLEKVSEHGRVRERSEARLAATGIARGGSVLDLGCGIGSNTLMLAEYVGPSGEVQAVDRSRTMLEIAERRARDRALAIACHEADAAALPFADGSFDLVWVERVLLHVTSPLAVMREARRVLKPGGQLVASEPDNASVRFHDGRDAALARFLERRWIEGIPNPRMGRQLEKLAREAGFAEIRVEAESVLVRDFDLASALFRWCDNLQSLAGEGRITSVRADAWLRTMEAEGSREAVIAAGSLFDLFARR